MGFINNPIYVLTVLSLVVILGVYVGKTKLGKHLGAALLIIIFTALLAPDLNNNQLDEIIELVAETKIDGVIASNTSTTRNNLKASDRLLKEIGNGGLSGQPIKELSTRVIKYLAQNSNKAFPIIGVGGIHSAQDALDKIEAGADLVQIYTGFIYEGPGLIKQINKALLN